MKNILGILLGIIVSTNCYAAWKYEPDGFHGDKFRNQNGGSHPWASCAWNCPNAKPCCMNWTVHSTDSIGAFETYYNMTCDEWFYPGGMEQKLYSGQKEECLKYEIAQVGGYYSNQCVEWKYFKGSIRMINEANTSNYMKNNCNPRYKDVVTE